MTSRIPPAVNLWRRENNWVFDEEVAFQNRFNDPVSDLPIFQLTNEPIVSSNIYPEAPISTHDGRYFIFSRRMPLSPYHQFWIADTETHWIRQVTNEEDATAPIFNPRDGCFYYLENTALIRIFPEDFSRELIFNLDSTLSPTHGALIPTGGLRAFDKTGRFSVFTARDEINHMVTALLDIEDKTVKIAYNNPEALNPHPQISQHNHPLLLIQVNNGIKYDTEGNLLALVGDKGASLTVCEVDGSNPVLLNVGFDMLERIQGHQCWVGNENIVITTMHRRKSIDSEWIQDQIVVISVEDNLPIVISEGPGFTHIHTDPEGRFWISDCNKSGDIYIGSIETGKFKLVSQSRSSFGSAQETHPHPFFIGNKNTVGWNSDCTGIPQIYFTKIPDAFFEPLL
jgi:hypothetical protein